MPQNSTGTIAIWKDATDVSLVALSPQDTGIRVRQVQAPTRVDLPDVPPSDGDTYDVVDADGSCSSTHTIVIAPPAGTTIRGASTFALSAPFAGARVVFDSNADDWVVELFASAAGATASEWGAAAAGNLNGSPTIVVSKSITPTKTGRLVCFVTAAMQNQSDSGACPIDVSITHGAGVLSPSDGPAVRYTINDNGGGREFGTIAFAVDLGRVTSPVIFPVGTPVTINAVFVPQGGQSAQWLDDGIQLTIQEQEAA